MTAESALPEDDLQAYVDDALTPERLPELGAVFAADPGAARRVAALKAQRSALRDALAPITAEAIPPSLDLDRLMARRLDEAATVSWSSRLRLVSAALAIMAIGVAAGWFARGATNPSSSGLAALADEASNMYGIYAPDHMHPVEIEADDKAGLLRWITGRLHRPVTAPYLAASGFRLMGGRVVPTPNGPAGMFMYDDDRGTRICLFLRPMTSKKTTPMTPEDRGVTKGITWSNNGMGYSLIGPATAENLHPLANEARRQMDRDV